MKVQGHEISQSIIDKAATWFPPERSFTCSELAGAMVSASVSRARAG